MPFVTRINCPRCASTDFTYGDKLALMPGSYSLSTCLCGNCGNVLVATYKSTILFLASIIAISYFIIEVYTRFGVQGVEVLPFGIFLIVFPVSYLVIWPLVLEAKTYRDQSYSRKSAWFFKSRIVSYGVYLIFPIMIILLLLYWGIVYET